jgi:hypothetical protein
VGSKVNLIVLKFRYKFVWPSFVTNLFGPASWQRLCFLAFQSMVHYTINCPKLIAVVKTANVFGVQLEAEPGWIRHFKRRN